MALFNTDEDDEPLVGGIRQKVLPKDIKLMGDMIPSSFGKCEVEMSAGRLVLLLQQKNPLKWEHFTLTELYNFYKKNGWDFNGALYGVSGPWLDDTGFGVLRHAPDFIIDTGCGMHVTNEFIEVCSNQK